MHALQNHQVDQLISPVFFCDITHVHSRKIWRLFTTRRVELKLTKYKTYNNKSLQLLTGSYQFPRFGYFMTTIPIFISKSCNFHPCGAAHNFTYWCSVVSCAVWRFETSGPHITWYTTFIRKRQVSKKKWPWLMKAERPKPLSLHDQLHHSK